MINIIIVLTLYSLVFLSSELVYKFHKSFLFSRKTAHILGSVISFFLPYFISNMEAFYFGIFFAVVIFISKKNNVFKGIHEKGGLGIGEVTFPLGMAISAFIFWPLNVAVYQGSCLILGFADGFAGYLGKKHGRKFYFGKNKTLEGSVVFLFLV